MDVEISMENAWSCNQSYEKYQTLYTNYHTYHINTYICRAAGAGVNPISTRVADYLRTYECLSQYNYTPT